MHEVLSNLMLICYKLLVYVMFDFEIFSFNVADVFSLVSDM